MKINPADIVTLPNAITLTGFGMAVHGATRLDTPTGLAETTAGRLLDLADGAVARATNSESEIGVALDAMLDKFAGLTIIAAEWQKDIAPKPALAAIIGQNLVNGVATAVAVRRHSEMNMAPCKNGKRAMAAQNAALAAYAYAEQLRPNHPNVGGFLRMAGHVATAVGVGYYGTKATGEYILRATQKPRLRIVQFEQPQERSKLVA